MKDITRLNSQTRSEFLAKIDGLKEKHERKNSDMIDEKIIDNNSEQ